MVFWAVVFIALFLITAGCKKEGAVTPTATQTTTDMTGKVAQQVGEFSCADSDGGVAAEKAGKVTGLSNGEEYVYYDKCYPPSPILVEYYCEGNEFKNQNVRCPSGTKCLGGLCRTI